MFNFLWLLIGIVSGFHYCMAFLRKYDNGTSMGSNALTITVTTFINCSIILFVSILLGPIPFICSFLYKRYIIKKV